MKYDVRYIHKVSQICKCGHPQSGHRRPRTPEDGPAYLGDTRLDSPVWGEGACDAAKCSPVPIGDYNGSTPCLAYTPGNIIVVELDHLPVLKGEILLMLREVHVLGKGARLRGWRVESDKLVLFPLRSVWHSIIITPTGEP